MSMIPTTEQRIYGLEREVERLRGERDEARELAKRFMLERNCLVDGIRHVHGMLNPKPGAVTVEVGDHEELVKLIDRYLWFLLDVTTDDKETVEHE